MSEYARIGMGDVKPSDTMKFCNAENEVVGTLYFGGPMRFEGDAEESAKIFFKHFLKRLVDEYLKSVAPPEEA